MRSELIDLYNLAIANPRDKGATLEYQRANDRIGPSIAIHEALDNDALRERVNRLEGALRAIATYSAYDDPDQRDIKCRDDVLAEIQKCSACKHAKQAKWPPSGLCDNHYDKYHRAQRRVENMYEYKQSWEPIEIARRALEGAS